MRAYILNFVGLVSVLSPLTAHGDEPPRFRFHDGDRIVLVGDTLIERDQRYGYLETTLTALNADKNLTFRNLGWSGDTVAGLSRAGFDPPAAGYKQLVEQVLAAKPTVLIVGYGMADSFDGEAGRSQFVEGLNRLLDAVAVNRPRVVLLSPIAHASLGAPWPDPAPHNAALESYTRSIEELAHKRGARFIDLFRPSRSLYGQARISDNGIHLNELGYRFLAGDIAQALEPEAFGEPARVELTCDIAIGPIREARVAQVETAGVGVRFRMSRQTLPVGKTPSSELILAVKGLSAGKYELKAAGHRVATGSADDWAKGVAVLGGPDREQVEQLRRTINRKNNLFFDRWRPQNITYLFGFRKHEQGNNAVEIPQFDPLVAEQEQEIARLRRPVPHDYELVRIESEVAR
ncbi:MAG: SGNH/GDSL hydrolase family protein [Isosphaeraceae bacterium]